MITPIKSRLKAETIAAAIYTATGIKPDVQYFDADPNPRNPLITFSKTNAEKMRSFLKEQLTKKADVDIDFMRIARPIVIGDLALPIMIIAAGIFTLGYVAGQMH